MQEIIWKTMSPLPCMVCHEAAMEYRATLQLTRGSVTLSVCAKCAKLTSSELLTLIERS